MMGAADDQSIGSLDSLNSIDPLAADADANAAMLPGDDDIILHLTPFALAFLALPAELRTHILTFLCPSDLGVLSRVVEPLTGVEDDAYLRAVWIRSTAPSRVNHALFSPLALRPDPLELVRRGTLRGAGVVAAVRAGTYWASPAAVRLSAAHDKLLRLTLRRTLMKALRRRPPRPALIAAGILPRAAREGASAEICARAHALDTALARCRAHRALRNTVGRPAADVLLHRAWDGKSERGRLAICPGIRAPRLFFESLAAAARE